MRMEDKVTLHTELEFATVTGLSQLLSKISEDITIRCPNWRWVLGIPPLIWQGGGLFLLRTSLLH